MPKIASKKARVTQLFRTDPGWHTVSTDFSDMRDMPCSFTRIGVLADQSGCDVVDLIHNTVPQLSTESHANWF